ncbi:hypothetical protein GYMLUDRAFT_247385 [Collybiopsis luxurians FD-317 M1]|uniref:Unplaced genomic scaffold GYMLUscaffold_46, whole genome shotgun sequence n=1 Tax=Collybiopsis luxurians FD-317 M1 TaxID=944289 RepID=A0A0D0BP33_9AGAR|nr:hypothetical protein GYMLUDRAFT_247385 [Collybiopsis luxurians FD-317 M1]
MTTTISSPGIPCPSTSSLQVLVDDSDVEHIHYSDGWVLAGNKYFECNGTVHGSEPKMGTHTTAQFSFEGVGVQVFGTIAPKTIQASSYQLDDLDVFNFTFNASTWESTIYRVQFYTSPQLEPGNHTLTISSLAVGSGPMYLDYILYNPMQKATTSRTLPSSTSSTRPASAPTARPLSSPQIHSPSRNIPVSAGAFAGGVVGGSIIGLVLGIVITFMFFRKRMKRNTLPAARETTHSPTYSGSSSSPTPKRATCTSVFSNSDSATESTLSSRTTDYNFQAARKHQSVPSTVITSSTGPDRLSS